MSAKSVNPELTVVLRLIEAMLGAECEAKGIPGLSAAVILGGRKVWAKGFGNADLEHKIPAGPHTIYRMASITKLFTATMLMQLRDAGKLSLDDPLVKYLPSFRLKSRFRDSRPITLRQVVSHTAGIPREGPIHRWRMAQSPSLDEVLNSLDQTESVFAPGTKYKYSNLSFALLGSALEYVAEQPYDVYITDHILRPLGMNESGFEVNEAMKPAAAKGYLLHKDGTLHPASQRPDGGAFVPVGQLRSSVADISRFIDFQFSNGMWNGRRVLSESTLREMHNPVFMNPDWLSGIGIGWFLSRMGTHVVISHDGGNPGFSADIAFLPDLKLGVAVLVNQTIDVLRLSHMMLEHLIPVMERLQALELAEKATPLPTDWPKFTGKYIGDHDLEVEISMKDGALVALLPESSEGSRVVLIPVAENIFRMDGGPADGEQAAFDVNADGQVTYLQGLELNCQVPLRKI